MNSTNKYELIQKIRKGEIDTNNQDLFFSNLIKGLLLKLDDDIKIRNISVPHIILHTGDFTMYRYLLALKGKEYNEDSIVSTEDIYNIIPRCIVNTENVDIIIDQITSPYSMGIMQFETDDNIYSLKGEFRRIPIKLNCSLKYFIDSYIDTLALMQQIITKLTFIQTYDITYLGQSIKCSYRIPESFSEEHIMEIDGTTAESKARTISLSIEIESSLPVWNQKTLMYADTVISNLKIGMYDYAYGIDPFDPNNMDDINSLFCDGWYPNFKLIDEYKDTAWDKLSWIKKNGKQPCEFCIYNTNTYPSNSEICIDCQKRTNFKNGFKIYGTDGINKNGFYEIS